VRLQESATLRFMDVDRPRGNFFGTRRLVGLLERTAAAVEAQAPGARMNVGELSARSGGNIVGHRSHENGRDVDLGFYMVDEAGVPVETRRFLDVRRSGRSRNAEAGLQFDPVRNWMMIEALVTDPQVVVQHAFVHRDVRQLLVRQGRRMGASDALIDRVERVVISPGVRHPHRNHFHVRIYCGPDDMPGCRDRGPYWPWLREGHPFHGRIVPLPRLDVDAQLAISATRRTGF
jgi:penicillin-insensitive murein endopeptidase